MSEPKIYEGLDVFHEFRNRGYYNSFQAKLWYISQLTEDRDKRSCYYRHLSPYPELKHGFSFPCCPATEGVRDLMEDYCVEGAPYIFTVYQIHHQQFLNVRVLALNFDVVNRELFSAWRSDQLYPGYPFHLRNWNEKYKEDGTPDV